MYYRMTVAGLERDLPICPVSDTLSIAGFVMFGDVEMTIRSAEELLPDKMRNIVVYCASGVRSFQAAQWLRRNGWRNVWDMGSLKAWPYGIEHS